AAVAATPPPRRHRLPARAPHPTRGRRAHTRGPAPPGDSPTRGAPPAPADGRGVRPVAPAPACAARAPGSRAAVAPPPVGRGGEPPARPAAPSGRPDVRRQVDLAWPARAAETAARARCGCAPDGREAAAA